MTRLAEFKKVQSLGHGTYGAVYKVIRRSTNKTYALKQVNMSKLSQREKYVAERPPFCAATCCTYTLTPSLTSLSPLSSSPSPLYTERTR